MGHLDDLEAQVRAAQAAAAEQRSQAAATAQQIRQECLDTLTRRGISPTSIHELMWKDRLFRSSRKSVKVPLGMGWVYHLGLFHDESGHSHYAGEFMRTDGTLFSFGRLDSSADARVQKIDDFYYKVVGTEPVLVESVSDPLPEHNYERCQMMMATFLASES